MNIVRLAAEYDLKPFDCGDADLNGFLMDDAKLFMTQRLAKTYLALEDEKVIAYFCLFNDKISRQELTSGSWRKVKKNFPHSKHLGSYPAVKIGRLAVSLEFRRLGLGSELMDFIKYILSEESGYSSFRFITVDAYHSAVPFYEKNGFKALQSEGGKCNTHAMYFDMGTL